MINAADGSILLLAPGHAEAGLRRATRRLARLLAEDGLPAHLAEPPAETGFATRLWWLRKQARRHHAHIVLSFAEEEHLLSSALPVTGLRRIWLQAHLPGWRANAAARRFWRLLPHLHRRARLIAATPAAREHLARAAGLPPESIALLPPPVNFPEPPPKVLAADLRRRDPVILFPGPLTRASQPGLLLKALHRLRDSAVSLALPAEGPQLRPIRHMLDSLALNERIIWLDSAALWPRWLERARVLCWPARIAPLPGPAVRALAAGLPVVGADVAGLRAALADSPCAGELVAVTDAEALAAALRRRLADPGDPAPRQALARRWSAQALLPRWRALLAGRS